MTEKEIEVLAIILFRRWRSTSGFAQGKNQSLEDFAHRGYIDKAKRILERREDLKEYDAWYAEHNGETE
jgi:hypothetical protein